MTTFLLMDGSVNEEGWLIARSRDGIRHELTLRDVFLLSSTISVYVLVQCSMPYHSSYLLLNINEVPYLCVVRRVSVGWLGFLARHPSKRPLMYFSATVYGSDPLR